jgi:hypothetical protein
VLSIAGLDGGQQSCASIVAGVAGMDRPVVKCPLKRLVGHDILNRPRMHSRTVQGSFNRIAE